MFTVSNDKSLIVLKRCDYEKALKEAFEKGVASAKAPETVSKAKSESGKAKVRRAVVESDE